MASEFKPLQDPNIAALTKALQEKAENIAASKRASSGLNTRSVTTVKIDQNGNPIIASSPSQGYGFTGPSMAETQREQALLRTTRTPSAPATVASAVAPKVKYGTNDPMSIFYVPKPKVIPAISQAETRREQLEMMARPQSAVSGLRQILTQGVQPAGTVAMPPGARPASVDRAFQQMGLAGAAPLVAPVNDPFRTFNPNADQSRFISTTPMDASDALLASLYPEQAQPSALSAITSAMAPRMMPGRPASLSATPQQAVQILRRGNQGANVGNIQNLLAQGGYNVGSVDGIFGPKTQAAVTAFQRANGLTPDGIIGSRTMAALNNPSSVAAALVPRQTAVAVPAAAKPRANNAVAAALVKPAGYGSKGVSKAGQELRNAFAYAM